MTTPDTTVGAEERLDCRECRAGWAQLADVGVGFRCVSHGVIQVSVADMVATATAPVEAERDALRVALRKISTRLRNLLWDEPEPDVAIQGDLVGLDLIAREALSPPEEQPHD